jgi:hypothetical protein
VRSFSLHVEASAGERAAGKTATVEISTDSRKLRSAAASSVRGARDPTNSNRYTCKLPMRRRSEGERLGSFTDDEGARAAAMARRPALQLGGNSGEGMGRRGSLDVGEEGCGGALGRLYRLGRGGEAAPWWPWPSMAAALIEIKGGEVKEGAG